MFEYGNLKYVENEDREVGIWYFSYKVEGKYIESELDGNYFLEILNELGREGWELVSVDGLIGFVLKRGLNNAKNN